MTDVWVTSIFVFGYIAFVVSMKRTRSWMRAAVLIIWAVAFLAAVPWLDIWITRPEMPRLHQALGHPFHD